MKSEWRIMRAEEFIDFNPRLSIKKGEIATKISMDKLQPFTKQIPETGKASFTGGAKFCNGDTIMARITPCLENGKTAFVDILADEEVAFGSTEFIVMRAKKGISDPQFVYYLAISPDFRQIAIQSMVGSSGRQRVQQDVLNNVEIAVPALEEQERIGSFLKRLDDKIALNNKINDNLERQARLTLNWWMGEHSREYKSLPLSDIATVNDSVYSPKEQWHFVNYLDTSSITDGIITELHHIVPAIDKLPSRARRKIVTNDIVFSTVRPNQHHFGIIKQPVSNMLVSTGFAVIRSKTKEICNELIYLRLTEDSFIESMQQIAEQSTSTFPSIKPSDLYQCEIPCPIDNKLTILLENVFSIIAINQKENLGLSQLRDALLPKLMNGEIEL